MVRVLFFAVFAQNILIILLLFCHGWGLHSFDSLQVEFLRMFADRKTQCNITDLWCFKPVAHGCSDVCGALSRGQQQCRASLMPYWLYLWSDLLPGHNGILGGSHSLLGTSALYDIYLAGVSHRCLVSWAFFFSLSEPKLPQEMKPGGCTRIWKQANFPNELVS